MSVQNGGHLLAYASSILNPDVFSHGVWYLFSENSLNPSEKFINDLLEIAHALLNDDPGSACQVLLICVVS